MSSGEGGAAAGVRSTGAESGPPRQPVVVSPGVHKRLTTGPSGYVMALLACFALVGLIVLITPRDERELLPTADFRGHALALRESAPYTSYAPQGLPTGWRATSSRLTGTAGGGPVAWHLGFVTPNDEYAALEESNENPAEFIARMTNQKLTAGVQQVAGAPWQRHYRPDKKQRSLVRSLPGVTLVVTGTASYDELAVLVGALRPQPKP